MLYATEKYGQGYMNVNGQKFTFSYWDENKMILVRKFGKPFNTNDKFL